MFAIQHRMCDNIDMDVMTYLLRVNLKYLMDYYTIAYESDIRKGKIE